MHRQVSELSARVESVSTKQESDYEVLNDQISDVQIYAENADKKLSNYKVENENSNTQMLNTFETLDEKLSKLKKATKENYEKVEKYKFVNDGQASDLERLQSMYSKISITATILSKSNQTDALVNISDVVQDVQKSIADQCNSKIKFVILNITNNIDSTQIETLRG